MGKILSLIVVSMAMLGNGQFARAQKLEGGKVPPPGFPLPFVTKTPQELAKQLESKDVKERLAAVNALYFIKWGAQPAIPTLAKVLKDPDAEVRAMAAGCFYFLDVKREHGVVPVLADLMANDANQKVRGSCACTLCRLSYDQDLSGDLVPIFRQALKDEDKYVRVHAATALAKLGQDVPKAMQVLAGFLDTEDEKWQVQIAWSFADAGRSALPTLKEALLHETQARLTATRSLIGVIERMQSKKQEIPDDLISSLAGALDDSDPRVPVSAARALTIIGPKAIATIPRIIKLLDHADPTVRYSVAIDLGDFGPVAKAAVPKLEQGLTDKDWRMRGSAGYALVGILGQKSIPFLEKALADPEWRVSRPAAEMLKRLNAEP